MDREFAQSGVVLRPLDRADMEEMLPGLGPQWVWCRHEPSCRDMSFAAIHQGFLSMARRAGAELRCYAVVTAAERRSVRWLLTTKAGQVSAETVVVAAGAWADDVAALLGARPVGIRPFRRTVVQADRSEEHTSELQSLMRISYAVFCLKKKKKYNTCYDALTRTT